MDNVICLSDSDMDEYKTPSNTVYVDQEKNSEDGDICTEEDPFANIGMEMPFNKPHYSPTTQKSHRKQKFDINNKCEGNLNFGNAEDSVIDLTDETTQNNNLKIVSLVKIENDKSQLRIIQKVANADDGSQCVTRKTFRTSCKAGRESLLKHLDSLIDTNLKILNDVAPTTSIVYAKTVPAISNVLLPQVKVIKPINISKQQSLNVSFKNAPINTHTNNIVLNNNLKNVNISESPSFVLVPAKTYMPSIIPQHQVSNVKFLPTVLPQHHISGNVKRRVQNYNLQHNVQRSESSTQNVPLLNYSGPLDVNQLIATLANSNLFPKSKHIKLLVPREVMGIKEQNCFQYDREIESHSEVPSIYNTQVFNWLPQSNIIAQQASAIPALHLEQNRVLNSYMVNKPGSFISNSNNLCKTVNLEAEAQTSTKSTKKPVAKYKKSLVCYRNIRQRSRKIDLEGFSICDRQGFFKAEAIRSKRCLANLQVLINTLEMYITGEVIKIRKLFGNQTVKSGGRKKIAKEDLRKPVEDYVSHERRPQARPGCRSKNVALLDSNTSKSRRTVKSGTRKKVVKEDLRKPVGNYVSQNRRPQPRLRHRSANDRNKIACTRSSTSTHGQKQSKLETLSARSRHPQTKLKAESAELVPIRKKRGYLLPKLIPARTKLGRPPKTLEPPPTKLGRSCITRGSPRKKRKFQSKLKKLFKEHKLKKLEIVLSESEVENYLDKYTNKKYFHEFSKGGFLSKLDFPPLFEKCTLSELSSIESDTPLIFVNHDNFETFEYLTHELYESSPKKDNIFFVNKCNVVTDMYLMNFPAFREAVKSKNIKIVDKSSLDKYLVIANIQEQSRESDNIKRDLLLEKKNKFLKALLHYDKMHGLESDIHENLKIAIKLDHSYSLTNDLYHKQHFCKFAT